MKTPKTTPVKNMPTHGPGTYAFYKGSKCKILSIGGGKAKIMVNGQIKLVNYTSLDDEMYGTGTNLPINESEKQDAYQEFFRNKLKDYGVESPSELSDEDKSKFFSEIKSEWKGGSVNESISIKGNLSDDTFAEFINGLRVAKEPFFQLLSIIQGNYVAFYNYDEISESESQEFEDFDKSVKSRFKKSISYPLSGGLKIDVYTNKNRQFICRCSDMSGDWYFVPASGKLNE